MYNLQFVLSQQEKDLVTQRSDERPKSGIRNFLDIAIVCPDYRCIEKQTWKPDSQFLHFLLHNNMIMTQIIMYRLEIHEKDTLSVRSKISHFLTLSAKFYRHFVQCAAFCPAYSFDAHNYFAGLAYTLHLIVRHVLLMYGIVQYIKAAAHTVVITTSLFTLSEVAFKLMQLYLLHDSQMNATCSTRLHARVTMYPPVMNHDDKWTFNQTTSRKDKFN